MEKSKPFYDLADRIKDSEISDREINDAFGELSHSGTSLDSLKIVSNMAGAMNLVESLVRFISKKHTIEIRYDEGKYFVDIEAFTFFGEGEHKDLYRAILIAGLNLMGIMAAEEII